MARETADITSVQVDDLDDLGLQDFLDGLGRALTSGDTAATLSHWETPAFVLGEDIADAIEERAELQALFTGAREAYNARGVVDTRPQIIRIDEITDDIACVRVRWPWLDDQDREVGSETSTYTLRRDSMGEWKIRVAVMHGAEAVN